MKNSSFSSTPQFVLFVAPAAERHDSLYFTSRSWILRVLGVCLCIALFAFYFNHLYTLSQSRALLHEYEQQRDVLQKEYHVLYQQFRALRSSEALEKFAQTRGMAKTHALFLDSSVIFVAK